MDWAEERKATAIKTALDAATPATVQVFDMDEVPAPRPENYIVVTVARRYVPERRFSGEVTVPGGRLVIKCGSRSVSNLRETRRRVFAAIEDVPIPVVDEDPLIAVHETSNGIAFSDGWYDAADSFTF